MLWSGVVLATGTLAMYMYANRASAIVAGAVCHVLWCMYIHIGGTLLYAVCILDKGPEE